LFFAKVWILTFCKSKNETKLINLVDFSMLLHPIKLLLRIINYRKATKFDDVIGIHVESSERNNSIRVLLNILYHYV
jgi:hypothetical protein